MEANKIEELINQGISIKTLELQRFVEKQAEIAEKLFDRENQFYPLRADLLLGHLDILLEAAKNLLLVSSTVFIAALALNTSAITNIDVDLIRKISIIVMVVSALSMVGILWIRGKEKSLILESINKTAKVYGELVGIKFEALELTINKKSSEIKEAVKARMKKNEEPKRKNNIS